jgi:hypothetical protein
MKTSSVLLADGLQSFVDLFLRQFPETNVCPFLAICPWPSHDSNLQFVFLEINTQYIAQSGGYKATASGPKQQEAITYLEKKLKNKEYADGSWEDVVELGILRIDRYQGRGNSEGTHVSLEGERDPSANVSG